MSIHKDRPWPTAGRIGTRVFVAVVTGLHHGQAFGQNTGWPVGAPALQRMIVKVDAGYMVDYAETRGIDGRAFVMVDVSGANSRPTTSALLWGRNLGTVRPPEKAPSRMMHAYRWTVGGQTFFSAKDYPVPHGPNAGRVLRFSMDLFQPHPDGTAMFNSKKLPGPSVLPPEWGGGKAIPSVGLAPIGAHQMGIRGWKVGDKPVQDGLGIGSGPPKEIHYDIRALDDERLELYMTADGKLQRWLFDGKAWRLQKDYTTEIKGPFLVCNEGKAAVAECNGHWCLIEPLDADEPALHRIVPKVEDEPLLVIEDRVTGKTYFEQQNALYDDRGGVLRALPRVAATPTKVSVIVDFVRSLRPE